MSDDDASARWAESLTDREVASWLGIIAHDVNARTAADRSALLLEAAVRLAQRGRLS